MISLAISIVALFIIGITAIVFLAMFGRALVYLVIAIFAMWCIFEHPATLYVTDALLGIVLVLLLVLLFVPKRFIADNKDSFRLVKKKK